MAGMLVRVVSDGNKGGFQRFDKLAARLRENIEKLRHGGGEQRRNVEDEGLKGNADLPCDALFHWSWISSSS